MWRFVYTYLFSTVDNKYIYVGETMGKTRGRRLYNHVVRRDRLTNFGRTYQTKRGFTPEGTHEEIGRLYVRWFGGTLAQCQRLATLIVQKHAPLCNKRGLTGSGRGPK